MHKVSNKRQVTLPKLFCEKLGISPGDYVDFFEYDGKLTVVKKKLGSSKGSLKHLKSQSNISDNESLQEAIGSKNL